VAKGRYEEEEHSYDNNIPKKENECFKFKMRKPLFTVTSITYLFTNKKFPKNLKLNSAYRQNLYSVIE